MIQTPNPEAAPPDERVQAAYWPILNALEAVARGECKDAGIVAGEVVSALAALSPAPAPQGWQPDEYHRVMTLLQASFGEHGLCQPRARRACSACNAADELAKLAEEYGGPPLVRSAPPGEAATDTPAPPPRALVEQLVAALSCSYKYGKNIKFNAINLRNDLIPRIRKEREFMDGRFERAINQAEQIETAAKEALAASEAWLKGEGV